MESGMNSLEKKNIYFVDIIPDIHYGLGIKLDEKDVENDDGESEDSLPIAKFKTIYISSFKKHPITKEAMAAELSGMVNIGDELVSINDIQCFRSTMSFIVPTVRKVLQSTSPGQSVRMTLLRKTMLFPSDVDSICDNDATVRRLRQSIDQIKSRTFSSMKIWQEKIQEKFPIDKDETVIAMDYFPFWKLNTRNGTKHLTLLFIFLYRVPDKFQNEVYIKLYSAVANFPANLHEFLSLDFETIIAAPTTFHGKSPTISIDDPSAIDNIQLFAKDESDTMNPAAGLLLKVDVLHTKRNYIAASFVLHGDNAPTDINTFQFQLELCSKNRISFDRKFILSGAETNKWSSSMEVTSHLKCNQTLSMLQSRYFRDEDDDDNDNDISRTNALLEQNPLLLNSIFVSSVEMSHQSKHLLHIISALQCPQFNAVLANTADEVRMNNNLAIRLTKVLQQLLALSSKQAAIESRISILPAATTLSGEVNEDKCGYSFPQNSLAQLYHDYHDKLTSCINNISVYFIVQTLEGKPIFYKSKNFSMTIGHYRYTPFALLTVYLLTNSIYQMLVVYEKLVENDGQTTSTAPKQSTNKGIESSLVTTCVSPLSQLFTLISASDSYTITLLWDFMFQSSWLRVLSMLKITLYSKTMDLTNLKQITKKFNKKVKVQTVGVVNGDNDEDEEEDEEDDYPDQQRNFASDLQGKSKEKVKKIYRNVLSTNQIVNLLFSKSQKQIFDMTLGYIYNPLNVNNESSGTESSTNIQQIKLLQAMGYQLFQTSHSFHSLNMTNSGIVSTEEKDRWDEFHDTFASPDIDILTYASNLKMSFWLLDLSPLLEAIHSYALQQYKTTKSSMKIFLEMILIGKRDRLFLLAKADSSTNGRQLLNLLTTVEETFNPHNDDEDKFDDLQKFLKKNAFALMRKQRYRDAVAVFLLYPTANMLKAAHSVLIQQCDQPFLAHLILRIIEYRFTSYRLYFPLSNARSPLDSTLLTTITDEIKTIYCHDLPSVCGKFTKDLLEKDILPRVLEAAIDLPEKESSEDDDMDYLSSSIIDFHGLQGFSAALFAILIGLWVQNKALLHNICDKVYPIIEKFVLEYDHKETAQLLPIFFYRYFGDYLADQMKKGGQHHSNDQGDIQRDEKGHEKDKRIIMNCARATFGKGVPVLYHYQQVLNCLLFLWESSLFIGEEYTNRIIIAIDSFLHKHQLYESHLQLIKVLLSYGKQKDSGDKRKLVLKENAWYNFMKSHADRTAQATILLREHNDKTKQQYTAPPLTTTASNDQQQIETPMKAFNFSGMTKSTQSTTTKVANMLDNDDLPPPTARVKATVPSNSNEPKSALDIFDSMPLPRRIVGNISSTKITKEATTTQPVGSASPQTNKQQLRAAQQSAPKSALDEFDFLPSRPLRNTASDSQPKSALDEFEHISHTRRNPADLHQNLTPGTIASEIPNAEIQAANSSAIVEKSNIVSNHATVAVAKAALDVFDIPPTRQPRSQTASSTNVIPKEVETIASKDSTSKLGEQREESSTAVTSSIPLCTEMESLGNILTQEKKVDAARSNENVQFSQPSVSAPVFNATFATDVNETVSSSSCTAIVNKGPMSTQIEHISTNISVKNITPSKKTLPVNPFAPHQATERDKALNKTDNSLNTSTESTKSLPERLRDFYFVHNPSKVDSIPEILEKYKGKENELLIRLQKQYHVSKI